MSTQQFTLAELEPILLAALGDDGIDFGSNLDTKFEQLGFDSLALLEISSRIEREYDVALEDGALAGDDTLQTLIELVNADLSAKV